MDDVAHIMASNHPAMNQAGRNLVHVDDPRKSAILLCILGVEDALNQRDSAATSESSECAAALGLAQVGKDRLWDTQSEGQISDGWEHSDPLQ